MESLLSRLPIILAGIGVLLFGAMLWGVEPIPQSLDYHNFADQRPLLGIPHCCDVLSNLPYLLVGLWGLWLLRAGSSRSRQPLTVLPELMPAYYIFCVGVALVAFGSGYYHWQPNNGTLVWDRLPMTIAFMSLVAIVVAEFISVRTGQRLLWPLLVIGLASVVWWAWTESQGRGDLRFYGLVQFVPMLLIPLILWRPALWGGRARFSHTRGYWYLLLCYLLAKMFEHFDAEIYALLGETLSGHSAQHVISGVGVGG